jgi:DNA-binding MarR family transcriptional regulator
MDMKPGFYTSLSLILKNLGLPQKALAKAIQRDSSTIVPMLDAFENKNWIVRQRREEDRRAHALNLTPAGKTAAKHLNKKVGIIEAKIAAHLGQKDTRELKALLNRLEALFEQHSQ